ncbi:MAG: prepilin-type N-terminal cleavage/methylation domain-containing protein, partial [bacterium]
MKKSQTHVKLRRMRTPVTDGHRSGFTLMETMVSLLLCSMVLGTIISAFTAQYKSFFVGNSHVDLNKEVRTAMDWIANDSRWANALPTSRGAYGKSNTCLILEIPSIDSAGDVIDVENTHDYIIYTQNGTDLRRVVDADPSSSRQTSEQIVAQHIGSLLFSTGSDSVGITITARRTVSSLDLSNTISTT